jgi:peptidoglycan/xylan/chitin deacetylase (PgdA/CDA1 family)
MTIHPRTLACLIFSVASIAYWQATALSREPIPDKLVVLTFDDSVKSQFTVVRPILLKYRFGATFLITEGFDFKDNKRDYMTWDQIAQLHRDGFEIGNHTRDHLSITKENAGQVAEQIRAINDRCRDHGIPATTSFAWPGNANAVEAFEAMREEGIRFARRGGSPEYEYKEGRGFAYEPGLDHPLLIPSAGDARPDWTLEDFIAAVEKTGRGRIAVLQFHGVPDTAHDWVSTAQDKFEAYMHYLATHDYRVIAMRDLEKYVDPAIAPSDPHGVIRDRQAMLKAGKLIDSSRRPQGEDDLQFWLQAMHDHGFTRAEMSAATSLSPHEIEDGIATFVIAGSQRSEGEPLRVLPYPGGRHPRIGFLDGAIRPQRETKVSIFAPWKDGGYAVADVPEAIWVQSGAGRELLYLAHTHVPTMWDKQGIQLEPLEWKREATGVLSVERKLPNGVVFGTRVVPHRDHVAMEMWLTNGTSETLRGLVVQNCVMLKALAGLDKRTNDNKVIRKPYVACRNEAGDKWLITAWEPCVRPWANAPCPCLHSDPQFPDCEPGKTVRLKGWLSFYEGKEIDAELGRIEKMGWKDAKPE